MGLIHVKVRVSNPAQRDKSKELEALVDTGAMYSVIPASLLESLAIKPDATRTFSLANGETIERQVGGAVFAWQDYLGLAPVIFGEEKDKAILGVMSLEAMGLEVDPVKGELRPMELLLLMKGPVARR